MWSFWLGVFALANTIFAAEGYVLVKIPELGDVAGNTSSSAWTGRTIYQFFGVKFGETTSGQRRFMPSELVKPWTGVFNATIPGRKCPQVFLLEELLTKAVKDDPEDCLIMNIFTPRDPRNVSSDHLLPVMIYIHGGGFYEGAADYFPPNYLLENDVILVVPQYRLGPLGFLSLQTDGIPGNAGLTDQVLAMKWVNRYIKSFGGDNAKVTVFGQSSGACSISLHLMSPVVEPYLFQKAIIQSGAAFAKWSVYDEPLDYARDLYRVMTNSTASIDVMEKAFKNVTLTELMRSLLKQIDSDPNKLFEVGKTTIQKAGTIKYITEQPVDMMAMGKFRTVPMIAGVTKDEGTFLSTYFYDYLERFNLQDNDSYLRYNLTKAALGFFDLTDTSDALVDIFNDKYFKTAFDQNKNITFKDIAPGLSDILGVLTLKAQTLKQAKSNAMYQINSTYFYSFDYIGEHTRFGYGTNTSKYPFDGGAHHSNDLLYLFPYHYEPPLNKDDAKIAKLITELWTDFAVGSKPWSSILGIEWPPMHKGKNGPFLHINTVPRVSDDFVHVGYKTSEEIAL